jgi:hypothetical protein
MRPALFAILMAMLMGVVLTVPVSAFAQGNKQSVESLINKGQDHFDEQRYEESIQVLSAALLRPGIGKDEKISVFKLLAYNYIVLNRAEEGEGAVFGVLAQDPEFELPDSESPRFRDFFTSSREKWEELGRPGLKDDRAAASSVKMKHTAPAQVDAGMAIRLDGSIDDPNAEVDEVTLYYRTGSSGKFKKLKVKYTMRKFSVDLPAEAVEPPLVEYYIEALDKKGLPLATRGDAAGPLRIAVPEGGGVLTSPWFWIPVSVAVIAAVVIPVVIVSTASSDAVVRVNVFEVQ